jgi:regulatory protein
MILESIEKRRSKIILKFNNSDTLEIYYDVYLMLSLYKGDEVTSEKVKEILNMNAEYEIKNSAFRYLSNRSHSTFELKRKLKKKKFDFDIIDRVVSELLEKKYLDDFHFAENFVRNRIERRKEGIIKITSKRSE